MPGWTRMGRGQRLEADEPQPGMQQVLFRRTVRLLRHTPQGYRAAVIPDRPEGCGESAAQLVHCGPQSAHPSAKTRNQFYAMHPVVYILYAPPQEHEPVCDEIVC